VRLYNIKTGHYREVQNGQIYVAFNGQYISELFNGSLEVDDTFVFWVDGILGKWCLGTRQHIPGRHVIQHVLRDEKFKNIVLVGPMADECPGLGRIADIENRCIAFHPLPYGSIEMLSSQLGTLKTDHIDCIILLVPTPKQEILASHLVRLRGLSCPPIFCFGGALNMVLCSERPAPGLVSRVGLEWAWRLAFGGDRIRRVKRIVKIVGSLLALNQTRFIHLK
jgi:Glycosyl transferase WecG/TagA/CpsF family